MYCGLCQNRQSIKTINIKYYMSTFKLLQKINCQTNQISFIARHVKKFMRSVKSVFQTNILSQFYPQRWVMRHVYYCIRGLVGPRARLDVSEKTKFSLPCWKSDYSPLKYPARILFTRICCRSFPSVHVFQIIYK